MGLSDYINFAARLKGIHLLQQQMMMDVTQSGSFDEGTPATTTIASGPPEPPSAAAAPIEYGE